MDLPMSFQNISSLAILTLIIGMLAWMHLRRPTSTVIGRAAATLGFAYQWSATPIAKAKPEMLARFPELQSVVGDAPTSDVNLIRMGLFNMTEEIIGPEQITRPIEIRFPPEVTLLSATFSEALKTEWKGTSKPEIRGSMVRLPAEPMSPRSSLIFNFILRGDVKSLDVDGGTREHGSIMRVG